MSEQETQGSAGGGSNFGATTPQRNGPKIPQNTVEELITRATEYNSATPSYTSKKYLSKMQSIEKPLIEWLSNLATRESEDGYVPKQDEIAWIKRIARFYHELVPLLRRVLEMEFNHRARSSVFISHSGENKKEYAIPLKNYLKGSGIEGAFLDLDLPIGSKSDDEILWAAVSCKYFWCVLTKNFVQDWYPMRELMVGYIRHIQEPSNDFSLVIDCLETGRNANGAWMEHVLSVKALRLYQRDGKKHRPPANIQSTRKAEGIDERIHRIAAFPMADGMVLVPSPGQLVSSQKFVATLNDAPTQSSTSTAPQVSATTGESAGSYEEPSAPPAGLRSIAPDDEFGRDWDYTGCGNNTIKTLRRGPNVFMSFCGDTTIDIRDEPKVSKVRLGVCLMKTCGNVKVLVPPGTRVHVRGILVRGNKTPEPGPDTTTPWLHLTLNVFLLHGNVIVSFRDPASE